jgi:hypothetical protein
VNNWTRTVLAKAERKRFCDSTERIGYLKEIGILCAIVVSGATREGRPAALAHEIAADGIRRG